MLRYIGAVVCWIMAAGLTLNALHLILGWWREDKSQYPLGVRINKVARGCILCAPLRFFPAALLAGFGSMLWPG